ncbi:MAG: YifB family Mg chelatase-like AAA ATPase [Clostridiales Family XIII bacterium]|nr:YifB family Mg chelatase-like AAA ATPase [Clostridiales Family XIII bacterium]
MRNRNNITSIGLAGLEGYKVEVETSISSGLPAFIIVGLPDSSVQESRERVRVVLKNIGFEFPLKRILVNLAPADTRKEGPIYDLPIALGILEASGQLEGIPKDCVFVGELSLEGSLRPVRGMLPIALSARKHGAKEIFVPKDSAAEAALVRGITVYPAEHVSEIVEHLQGINEIKRAGEYAAKEDEETYHDFSDVKGQPGMRRALEVAVSGAHNILLCGMAGSGKSMMAKRIPSILPPMSMDEMIESTAVHSIAGMTGKAAPLLPHRPFRAPHHSVSSAGIAGGGKSLRPGEMSLAHNGVLFLDEFPEFRREVMESLRQPIEDGRLTITRASGSVTYPSDFMLVCAMNPCKCGWYGHPSGKCECSCDSVKNYRGRISGPIMDRIDIYVEAPPVDYEELTSKGENEPSSAIRERVMIAREVQLSRQGTVNARMSHEMIEAHCGIDEESGKLMRAAYEKFSLSARAYNRILKVARTVADMAGSVDIGFAHLAEAIRYRNPHG